MENNESRKKVIIFLGPPYSGKETQTTPLSKELGLPVFSMGKLIRDARMNNADIEEAFQQYTLRGLNVPIEIKFGLLRERMDHAKDGFILDNFPGTAEDLSAFNNYTTEAKLSVDKVFYLHINEHDMLDRFEKNPHRGRADDTKETLLIRSKVQGIEREPVLQYFRQNAKLIEINGHQSKEIVYEQIHKNL